MPLMRKSPRNTSTFLSARKGGKVGGPPSTKDGLERTETPTVNAVRGMKVPGHIIIGFCMVPNDENSTGIQIEPRMSIVPRAGCSVAPVTSDPTLFGGGSPTR